MAIQAYDMEERREEVSHIGHLSYIHRIPGVHIQCGIGREINGHMMN